MNFVHVFFFFFIDFFNWIILIFEIVSNWSSNTLDPLYMENIGKVKLLIIWLPMQSEPITTDVMGLNLNRGKVYNIMW